MYIYFLPTNAQVSTRMVLPGSNKRNSEQYQNVIFTVWNSEHIDFILWLRVRDVPGSIPSQGPRHTKDVIKIVPVVPLFSTEHSKGKILALSQELR